MVMSNIYNTERVVDIISKRNISLDYYHRLIFNVVDISNKGSLQLVIVNIPLHTVTVHRSQFSTTLGNKPGVQIVSLMSNILPTKDGEPEWTLTDLPEEDGSLEYKSGLPTICLRLDQILQEGVMACTE